MVTLIDGWLMACNVTIAGEQPLGVCGDLGQPHA
jgi:hypothetical protein